MKTVALTLFAAALGFAQAQPNTPASTTPAQKKTVKAPTTAEKKKSLPDQKATAQPPLQSVPAGAKLVEPNLYRFTDSNGKTWNYRQTPFGISKWEETSAPEPPPVAGEPVAVTDLGDSYRFEKKTPFGRSSWVHKKSELTDEEKALTSGVQPPPSGTTVDGKPAEKQ
jgi:hypothetical protein